MGSKKKVTIGYRYYLGFHAGIGRGPVNELVEVEVGGKKAWQGSVTGSGAITIAKPDLFGGDKKEGGISGTLQVMMGGPPQIAPAGLAAMLGGDVPGFRGFMSVYYDGQVSAMNPYIKPWKFRVRRSTAGWDGEAWYPTKAKIELSSGAIHAMNPCHIVYECLTNREWGGGMDRSRLDDASFRAAADALHAEGFGLCLRWNRGGSVSDFVQEVLDHIGGNLYLSRFDGLFHLTLIRDDYTVASLPLFDEDSGLLGVDEDDNAATAGALNELIVKWHDPISNEARSWRERNLGAVRADGQVLSETKSYAGLPTAELAGRVAVRELRAASSGLKRFKVRLDRRGYRIEPGQPFRIRSLRRGIGEMVVRAGRIEDGKLDDATITITAVQDVFGLPAAAMTGVQPSGWTPPDSTPQAVTVRKLMERTWRDIVQSTDPANLALIDPTACYLQSLAVKPSSMSMGYALETCVGSAAWSEADDAGDFCPSGLLASAIGPGDAAFVLASGADLDFVEVGGMALLGDEIVRIDSFDFATLSGVLGRGCVDTVPASHAAGTRLWFVEDSGALDQAAYAPSTTVQARLLTQTSSGQLAQALAGVDSLTMAQRQARPYPPGNLRVNGVAYPTNVGGGVTLSWAHRDRLLQADQLIDTAAGSIGPEPGTTYNMRLYDEAGGMVGELAGSSATSFSYPLTKELVDLGVPLVETVDAAYLDDMGLTLGGGAKWRGGAIGGDGKIYCVPVSVDDILIIDPVSGTAVRSPMGVTFQSLGQEKYNGAVAADGKVYGVPTRYPGVLIIDPATGTASVSDMGADLSDLPTSSGGMWIGGALGGDGKIYCAPSAASDILVINPANGTATRTTMGLTIGAGSGKYNGAVTATDGRVFFIPSGSDRVLVIDPATSTAELTDYGLDLSGGDKWREAGLGDDGKIYCMPSAANKVLVIDPATNTAELTDYGLDLSGGAKWRMGVNGGNGRIYGMPNTALDCLVIDTTTNTAVRSSLSASWEATEGSWRSGVMAGGVVYGIPLFATSVLQVRFESSIPYSVNSSLRVELESSRDGLLSWQRHDVTLPRLFKTPVKGRDRATPPTTGRVRGDAYIIPPGATGVWFGKTRSVAIWSGSKWVFGSPPMGWTAYIADEGVISTYTTNWSAGVPV